VYFAVWRASQWRIASVPVMDRYGFTESDDRFTLETDDNYVDILPERMRPVALAMQLSEPWGMSVSDVLAMPYERFYEWMLTHKAVTQKRPWWTGHAGQHAHMIEQTSHRRLKKPKRYKPQ